MKIYFAASILGKKRDEKAQKWQEKIIEALKEHGEDVWDGNFNTPPKLLYEETEEDYLEIYRRNEKIILNSDVVVAEVSMSDSGVGYEIALALNNRKPVLAMYNEESVEPTAPPIMAGKSKLLTFVKYKEDEIPQIIDKYLKEVKRKIDTKFILIISPEIDRYLEWASDYKRMHKAQIVRNAVEKEMENDPDYEKFLKEKK